MTVSATICSSPNGTGYPNRSTVKNGSIQRAVHQAVQENGEADTLGRLTAGIGHGELRPAVEKREWTAVAFADEDVFAARARHHRRQLGVGERTGQAEQAGDHPRRNHQRRRLDVAHHHARLEEDAGADDTADDDRGGGGEAETANEGMRGAVRGDHEVPRFCAVGCGGVNALTWRQAQAGRAGRPGTDERQQRLRPCLRRGHANPSEGIGVSSRWGCGPRPPVDESRVSAGANRRFRGTDDGTSLIGPCVECRHESDTHSFHDSAVAFGLACLPRRPRTGTGAQPDSRPLQVEPGRDLPDRRRVAIGQGSRCRAVSPSSTASRVRLGSSATTLADALDRLLRLRQGAVAPLRLRQHARRPGHARLAQHQGMQQEMTEVAAAFSAQASFIEPEILRLSRAAPSRSTSPPNRG